MGLSLLKPVWVSMESFSRVWKAIICRGGGIPLFLKWRIDVVRVFRGTALRGCHQPGDFQLGKKVETEMSVNVVKCPS